MNIIQLKEKLEQTLNYSINIEMLSYDLHSKFNIVDDEDIPEIVADCYKPSMVSLSEYGKRHNKSRVTISAYKEKFISYDDNEKKISVIEEYWVYKDEQVVNALQKLASDKQYAELRSDISRVASMHNIQPIHLINRILNEFLNSN